MMQSKDSSPLISVVIPAHNEEKYVALAIASIKSSSYKNIEIVVSCNACSDKTAAVAEKLGARTTITKKKGVSLARNRGRQEAKGKIICFLDADSQVAPDLLTKVNRAIQRGYVGGYTKTYGDVRNMKSKLMWFIGNFGRYFFPASSGFSFCRADLFEPYNEKLDVAEDTYFQLALRKKGRLIYITNSYILTSMRRQERQGYLHFIWQTFSGFFLPRKQVYAPVR